MRCHARDARDRSDLIERGRVDQTGYTFELCARGHNWYQRCIRREQTITRLTLGRKSMAIITLEPGYFGTAYT